MASQGLPDVTHRVPSGFCNTLYIKVHKSNLYVTSKQISGGRNQHKATTGS